MGEHAQANFDAASAILARLRHAGYVAYLAGGCVRDRLLGRVPKDHDVATNARPDEVCTLYPKARLVGAKFGVVLVRHGDQDIEVATFRTDGVYTDGRRPSEVSFGDEQADAHRRDFTINGLFYDPAMDRVIDYVGGQEDLRRGIIRTIGDADARFSEDHLRMLRAVRLSARLGFPIEEDTKRAIERLASHLVEISPERIWMELEIILKEPSRADGWRLLLDTGLRDHLSREWVSDASRDSLAARRLAALPDGPLSAGLVLAAALPDLDVQTCRRICHSFRLSNDLTDQVRWLISRLADAYRSCDLDLADFKMLRANDDWPLLLELLRADLVARELETSVFERATTRGAAITKEQAAPPPLVTGDDLLAMGVTADFRMGAIHRAVYRAQLNEEINTKDEGIAIARRLWETLSR